MLFFCGDALRHAGAQEGEAIRQLQELRATATEMVVPP
jgi:hypothetical protein